MSKSAMKKAESKEIQAVREAEAIALQKDTEKIVLDQKSEVNDLSHIWAGNISDVEAPIPGMDQTNYKRQILHAELGYQGSRKGAACASSERD